MKTDDLIGLLAQDLAVAPRTPRAQLLRWLPLALLAAAAAYLFAFGIRPDAATWPAMSGTAMKWSLGGLAAVVGGAAAVRLSRPEAGARGPLLALGLLAGLAAALLAAGSLAHEPLPFRASAFKCLVSVPVMAALPLAAFLAALRTGAVTKPALAGAFAGLGAAGLAILAYALHCTEDSAMFVGTWYVAAALLCAAIGAYAGARALRW
jgi:hypothetical protein